MTDEEGRRQHEYTLMEMRLMGEDIKADAREALKELCEKKIEPLELRATSLEATRFYAKGALKTAAVGIPAIGSIAYFLFEVGKALKEIFPHPR